MSRLGRRMQRKRKCARCGREREPRPISGKDAAYIRVLFGVAEIEDGDLYAYAHCFSTVVVTEENQVSMCRCDIANWNKAHNQYNGRGSEQCWLDLGVTPELMVEARERYETEKAADSILKAGHSIIALAYNKQ